MALNRSRNFYVTINIVFIAIIQVKYSDCFFIN